MEVLQLNTEASTLSSSHPHSKQFYCPKRIPMTILVSYDMSAQNNNDGQGDTLDLNLLIKLELYP